MIAKTKGFLASILRHLRGVGLEAIVWISGLIYLAAINPYAEGHLSFCLFKYLGFDFCPGCGLGRSMSLLLHGDLKHSIMLHPLGIAAFAILSARIISLLRRTFKVGRRECHQ